MAVERGFRGPGVAGGAYDEPPYMYLGPDEAPPAGRSATHGFRCMRPRNRERTKICAAPRLAGRRLCGHGAGRRRCVRGTRATTRLPATPFTPRVEEADSSNPAWTVERVTLPTGYDKTSFAVQLFLPTGRPSPSGVIFYRPHSGEFSAPVTTEGFDPATGGIPLDFLPKSGWALAVVAFDGAYERQWSAERKQSMSSADLWLHSAIGARNWGGQSITSRHARTSTAAGSAGSASVLARV